MCAKNNNWWLRFCYYKGNKHLFTGQWLYRQESGAQDLSCQILRNKYIGNASFNQSSGDGGSLFWKGLHTIKQWFKVGSTAIVLAMVGKF